ncbi:MAG: 3-octaprenyl-4-hydroxybenzoate carboxy-lyase, partial [Deltaproteobacteria bacterium]|nr:3-octaprenyl-4-hydroxybenzoate carboxy-lyase [Deltaproteobacteria bacterium]
MKRIVVGISGASGTIYGVRLLEVLREVQEVETHVIISKGARVTMEYETAMKPEDVEALADRVHCPDNLAAPVSSGSFRTEG